MLALIGSIASTVLSAVVTTIAELFWEQLNKPDVVSVEDAEPILESLVAPLDPDDAARRLGLSP